MCYRELHHKDEGKCEGVGVAERWQMNMLSYKGLPVFGQKWPTVSDRTSQPGPEPHPHQPETGEKAE